MLNPKFKHIAKSKSDSDDHSTHAHTRLSLSLNLPLSPQSSCPTPLSPPPAPLFLVKPKGNMQKSMRLRSLDGQSSHKSNSYDAIKRTWNLSSEGPESQMSF